MTKVITTVTHLSTPNGQYQREVTYPELDKLLADGYEILEKIHTVSNTTSFFSITFILQKSDN